MVKFLFSVHIITEAKLSNRQGESQSGGSASQVIYLACPVVVPPLPRDVHKQC